MAGGWPGAPRRWALTAGQVLQMAGWRPQWADRQPHGRTPVAPRWADRRRGARRRRSTRWIRRPGRRHDEPVVRRRRQEIPRSMQKALAGKSMRDLEPEERAKVMREAAEGCPCRSEADAGCRRRPGGGGSGRNGRRHDGWRRRAVLAKDLANAKLPAAIGSRVSTRRAPAAGLARRRRNHPREDSERDQHPEPGCLRERRQANRLRSRPRKAGKNASSSR